MRPLLLGPYYIKWHYTTALRKSFQIFENFVWFVWHFFSIGLLFHTLLTPWQRIQDERRPDPGFGPIIEHYVVNGILRIAGAVIRLTVIAAGFLCICMFSLLIVLFYIIWLAYPLFMLFFFVFGIGLLFI